MEDLTTVIRDGFVQAVLLALLAAPVAAQDDPGPAHAAALGESGASSAAAQDPVGQAQVLIDQGVALRREGDDVGALARFREAHALTQSARAMAQIALAEQALGRWIDAEAHLRRALSSDEAWIEQRRETLQDQLQVIRSHLGRLELLLGGVRDAAVTLNERLLDETGEPVWVEPGVAMLEVRAPGFRPFRQRVTSSAGETTTVRVELLADVPNAAPPPREGPASSRAFPFTEFGGTILVLGGLALGMSAVALALRNQEAEVINGAGCLVGGLTRGENCADRYDAALTWEAVSIATLVGGLVLAGGGAALLGLGSAGATPRSSTTMICDPLSGAVWGLTCRASF